MSQDKAVLIARIADLETAKSAAAAEQARASVQLRHTAEFTTPTGARYRSGAPPPPGRLDIFVVEPRAA